MSEVTSGQIQNCLLDPMNDSIKQIYDTEDEELIIFFYHKLFCRELFMALSFVEWEILEFGMDHFQK